MAWGGLAYGLRKWRLLQTVASLPGLLLLPCLWFLDESPCWLATQGRHHDAYRVLRKAARWNGATIPKKEDVVAILKAEVCSASCERDSNEDTLKERIIVAWRDMAVLCRSPYLRKITVLASIIYTLSSMVYFGLSLSGGELSANPFVYMVLSGLMEVPAYTVTVPVVDRIGRRVPGVFCFAFCGVTLLLLAAIPEDIRVIVTALALLGKMANSAAFTIVYYHCSELFPTVARSSGIGVVGAMSKVGSIVAPYILDFVGLSHPWAAFMVFGGASVIAAFSTRLLPETKGRALPDTLAQTETPHHPRPRPHHDPPRPHHL